MIRRLQTWRICLLLLLPVGASAQSEESPAGWLKQLPHAPADTTRVKLLLNLGGYYLYKAEEHRADLDSALLMVREANKLSETLPYEKWKTECLWLLGFCHFERQETAQGKAVFEQIIAPIQKSGDLTLEAETLMKMGSYMHRNHKTYETCIAYFQRAILLYRKIGEKEKPIAALKEIADIHLNQGKLAESENELLEVIELYKAIGYKNLHYTYDLLSAINSLKGNLNRALFFAHEMIKSMETTGDSTSAGTFYARLGRTYAELGQTEKSIEWYKKAHAKDPANNYYVCISITRGLIKIGKAKEALDFVNNTALKNPPVRTLDKARLATALGDCYSAMKQYEPAEKSYLKMVELESQIRKNNAFTASVNYTLGDFYVNWHRYPTAAPYLQAVLAIPEGIVTAQQLKDTYLLLFKVDSAQGNYLSAIRYFQVHKQLNDSIFNEAKSRQIEELQIQYETNKKEQDLAFLQKESTLQESRLQQANLAKNLSFGGGGLLLLVLGLLYNRSRHRRLTNRRLELQQIEINQTNRTLQHLLEEKERLLREIHHRVKNNLQIVMSLLNSQSAYLENDTALEAIRESQQRIHSISLIHQKLYQSENAALIEMPVYIRELTEYLQDSFNTGQSIRFDLQIDPIELDVTQAVPVGLILNEAISNAIKYAFPNQQTGAISISMQHTEEGRLKLVTADNGVGLPPDFDIEKTNSLGMSLMRGLSEQLNGSFDLKSANGLAIHISFEQTTESF